MARPCKEKCGATTEAYLLYCVACSQKIIKAHDDKKMAEEEAETRYVARRGRNPHVSLRSPGRSHEYDPRGGDIEQQLEAIGDQITVQAHASDLLHCCLAALQGPTSAPRSQ